jgi:hypothetical protein
LSQTGNLSADGFLNRRPIDRTLAEKPKQQGGCKSVGIHPEFAEDLHGFRTALDRLAGAFIVGKLAGDQLPRSFQATRIDAVDNPLDGIEGSGPSLQCNALGIHL